MKIRLRAIKAGELVYYGRKIIFFSTIEIGDKLCIRVCFSFFFVFFSTHNQLPQLIIEVNSVICNIEAPSVMIRTTLNSFQVMRKTGFKVALVIRNFTVFFDFMIKNFIFTIKKTNLGCFS